MRVELGPDAAKWVEAEIESGRFATAEAAVDYAINSVKLSILRAELEAAEKEGGSFTTEEVLRFARGHLDNLESGR